MARRLRILAVVVLALAVVSGFSRTLEAQSVVTAQILTFWNLLKAGSTSGGVTYAFTNEALVSNGYISWGTLRGTSGYGVRDNNGTIEIKNNGGSWAAPAGGANPLATYIVKTSTSAPANAQVLASLGTGLVLNTTATGVLSIYGGAAACTNQFVTAISASGATTCASVTGATISGQLPAANFPILTGDVTTPGGSLATTLAATGVGAGSVGSSTAIPVITFDAKGRATVKTTATPQLTLTATYFSSLSAASLTGIPGANVTGTLAAAAFPALTGDVTTVAGALATTVAKIGGHTVLLGGNLTLSGAFATTFTFTAPTAVTFPVSGTLIASSSVFPDLVTQGDLMVATAANTVGSLADVATGRVLVSGGVGTVPAYSASPTLTSLGLGIAPTFPLQQQESAASFDVLARFENTSVNAAAGSGLDLITGTVAFRAFTVSQNNADPRVSMGAESAHPLVLLVGNGETLRISTAANVFVSWGGTTNAFPALRRASTALESRLADDSAYAPFTASVSTATTTLVVGGTAVGAAKTTTTKTYATTGIADGVATPTFTVTIPNGAESANLHVIVTGSIGAGGAIGANECSNTLEGNIAIARTAGVAAVPVAAAAAITATACVAGATTETLAYAVSAVAGAVGATNTFTVNVTVTKGGGGSNNHTALIVADLLNANGSGVTLQ